jgi:exosome complex RNA-binding protein Csl4
VGCGQLENPEELEPCEVGIDSEEVDLGDGIRAHVISITGAGTRIILT